MPSGRDSFRRNRVAPSVQPYFSTSAQRLDVAAVIRSRFWVKTSYSLGNNPPRVFCKCCI
jgi:hypothetical protein